MSLNYEPASEPLRSSVKDLFLNCYFGPSVTDFASHYPWKPTPLCPYSTAFRKGYGLCLDRLFTKSVPTLWGFRGSFPHKSGVNVTKFAPHKALKLIALGKLTFDERVLLNRVGGQLCGLKGCGFHLTQCINEMVLETQLPHKSVNLLF